MDVGTCYNDFLQSSATADTMNRSTPLQYPLPRCCPSGERYRAARDCCEGSLRPVHDITLPTTCERTISFTHSECFRSSFEECPLCQGQSYAIMASVLTYKSLGPRETRRESASRRACNLLFSSNLAVYLRLTS